jgi:hypothetical protein
MVAPTPNVRAAAILADGGGYGAQEVPFGDGWDAAASGLVRS